jgi:polysaccharide pyruvyl transferase WcaK-like protein
MPFVLHIGFDFWGAGNLGDDLMLAGFQSWWRAREPDLRISALCAHDIAAMRRRFPDIQWFGSDPAAQAQALQQADAWIGLGGGVFQTEVGPWILDQMAMNMAAARARGIRCFLVGVGVNNEEALSTGQAHQVCQLASQIWMRDQGCTDLALRAGFQPEITRLGADTAHLLGAEFSRLRDSDRRASAFVLHASPTIVSPDAIARVIAQSDEPWRWVCQESRTLADSEMELYATLPAAVRARLPLAQIDYAHASLPEIMAQAASWHRVLSSRYHTTLASAWAGAEIAVFERNYKLRAIREELGIEPCASLADPVEMVRSLGAARAVARDSLELCFSRANRMMEGLRRELGLG